MLLELHRYLVLSNAARMHSHPHRGPPEMLNGHTKPVAQPLGTGVSHAVFGRHQSVWRFGTGSATSGSHKILLSFTANDLHHVAQMCR